ncbi:tungstate ABC transporter substrate-binding protein WtpA [Hippea maritima]|uniref:Tungstate ABC transporter binding protein WtpA n=1 Tax=Hippea maritima (strain ATCC 700847 / DSM 10411 / MH2) TaxID=760142 RepID=F2LVH0_HIPMA|nr:tungstate ABC transporter substrate-binding protein WtpA [Hippea maritima]AEA33754.1 tungstate ABC transporter binding protein WtpA [Hippea maritima DSM 10411]
MKSIILFLAFLFLMPQAFAKQPIVVFHAGSLSVPLKKVAHAFEKKYPMYKIVLEASGSRMAARKIVDLRKPCDIMASADYSVIDNLLINTGNAKFNALFATNEMAIVFTNKSRYANTINSNNWTDILLKKDVIVGHSNPNDDPCGYRAMLVVKLSEKYYHKKGLFKQLFGYPDYYQDGFQKKGKIIVRPKETDLIALLKMHYIDYIFLYKSVAIQHHLRYIELPKEVSLCCKSYDRLYKTVSFRISGKKPGEFITKKGSSMVYGLTIPQNSNSPINKKGAVLLVKFILSKEGQDIIKSCGQGIINPPIIKGNYSILNEN